MVRVARSLVLCVMFCISLLVHLSFIILAIVLSVFRFTVSDYTFGILKLFLLIYRRYLENTIKLPLRKICFWTILTSFKIKIFIVMFVLVMNNEYILLTVPMALVTEHPIASAGVSGCVCVAGGMGVLQYEKHDLGSEWVSC